LLKADAALPTWRREEKEKKEELLMLSVAREKRKVRKTR